MNTNSDPSATPISAARRATVQRALKGWIDRLIDLSRRNNLLYYRDLKIGTLDISSADPRVLSALYGAEEISARRLCSDADQAGSTGKLVEIQRKALGNLEERGLDTLFVAIGMATWKDQGGGRPPEAPVLLMPLEIRRVGSGEIRLQRSGEALVNKVLLHALKADRGVVLSPTIPDEHDDDPMSAFSYFRRELLAACHEVEGFDVSDRVVIGNFSFHKMAIVSDLTDQSEELIGHDLIAAISGDPDARETISSSRDDVDMSALDRTPAEQEFLILDADSSQQAAIVRVLTGKNGTIQGPPGTGKSQTIANIIAELAARGKRVLFVAEKRAALDVVLDRLTRSGLGHLVLDLHGAETSRKQILRRLGESQVIARNTAPVDATGLHGAFERARARLVEHVHRIHAPRAPSGMSAFGLQGAILAADEQIRSRVRWRGDELNRLNPSAVDQAAEILAEASAHARLFLGDEVSPWSEAVLEDGAEAQEAIDRIQRILQERLTPLAASLEAVTGKTGLRRPTSVADARRVLSVTERSAELAQVWSEEIFEEDLDALIDELSRASSAAALIWVWMTRASFRNSLRVVKVRRSGRSRIPQVLAELIGARDLSNEWRALGGISPAMCADAPLLGEQLRGLLDDLRFLHRRIPRHDFESLSLQDLSALLQHLFADQRTALVVPQVRRMRQRLKDLSCDPFVGELRRDRPAAVLWERRYRYAWLASCLDRVWAEEPALASFSGRGHDMVGDEFRRLDQRRIELAIQRVSRAHAERVVAARSRLPAQDDLVNREVNKKTRHLPFRKLVQEAGELLTALRPCWMASPLSVSQLLPADRNYFDVVLFDEASQILPEDAVAAILRAKNAVVAGDRHQLPPTTFFTSVDDEDAGDEGDAPASGFESLLDLMSSLCEGWSLDWHYRSRDETLIAFSNHHVYADRLVTFPGPGLDGAISHVAVSQRAGVEGQEDSVSSEVERVVALVLEHARSRPGETLGVIAMGIKHSNRIQAALDQALVNQPEVARFFDESRKERFFVKNLERVQGDERDAIILSVGYGKDGAGRLPYRFGPLLVDGGERRLNVAITRARSRLTLVSSFTHHDMDPSRSKARGVELLRLYLEYAASGGKILGTRQGPAVALNDFEQDVMNALSSRGMQLIPQWGASKYRLDFAARHPEKPGRLVLAIECDGATYHSAPTARDRDRLRQRQLEALGWRFHRIWSTDWFFRREDEIDRALAAYREAITLADSAGLAAETGSLAPAAPAPTNSPSVGLEGPRGRSAQRPKFRKGLDIDEYPHRLVVEVVNWIRSDGRLRTDEELMSAACSELGFLRRGSRIEAAVRRAIAGNAGDFSGENGNLFS